MNAYRGKGLAATGIALLLSLPAWAQTTASLEAIHARALSANNTAQHATVAKEYRLQGDAFAKKAATHEQEADRLTRASGAMVHKWPAMASRQLQREKALAVEARRAEREARELADRHLRLAVEAQGQKTVAAEN